MNMSRVVEIPNGVHNKILRVVSYGGYTVLHTMVSNTEVGWRPWGWASFGSNTIMIGRPQTEWGKLVSYPVRIEGIWQNAEFFAGASHSPGVWLTMEHLGHFPSQGGNSAVCTEAEQRRQLKTDLVFKMISSKQFASTSRFYLKTLAPWVNSSPKKAKSEPFVARPLHHSHR